MIHHSVPNLLLQHRFCKLSVQDMPMSFLVNLCLAQVEVHLANFFQVFPLTLQPLEDLLLCKVFYVRLLHPGHTQLDWNVDENHETGLHNVLLDLHKPLEQNSLHTLVSKITVAIPVADDHSALVEKLLDALLIVLAVGREKQGLGVCINIPSFRNPCNLRFIVRERDVHNLASCSSQTLCKQANLALLPASSHSFKHYKQSFHTSIH